MGACSHLQNNLEKKLIFLLFCKLLRIRVVMEAHELCLDANNLNYSLIRVKAATSFTDAFWKLFSLHIAATHENCMFTTHNYFKI